QTDLASLGLNAAQCSEALQCVDLGRNETLSGHRAVARALDESRFPWSIFGRLIGFAPLSPLGALIYRLVANNRHRLPGGTPACKVTTDR
ncbi:MAG: thiol-disulfide oxidoreductase DCC family protein, partial [Ilumatobacteraceae bacterium]